MFLLPEAAWARRVVGILANRLASDGGIALVVLWVVADRLAQPEGQWRPFVPPAGLLGRIYRLTTSRRHAPACAARRA